MKKNSMNNEDQSGFDAFSHIRFRPWMYIGKGNGEYAEDGIYEIFRNIINFTIDAISSCVYGEVCIDVEEKTINISAYNAFIPLERIDTYICPAFVNIEDKTELSFKLLIALSQNVVLRFTGEDNIGNVTRKIIASRGIVVSDKKVVESERFRGMSITYEPDVCKFENYHLELAIIESIVEGFAYCYPTVVFNLRIDKVLKRFSKPDGMLNLVENFYGYNRLPSIGAIHIKTDVLDLAIVPSPILNGGVLKSYVNGEPTIRHGKHVTAMISTLSKIFYELFHIANFSQVILPNLIIAMNFYVMNPEYSSCIKGKLLSGYISDNTMYSIDSYFEGIIMTPLRDSIENHHKIYESLCRSNYNPDI